MSDSYDDDCDKPHIQSTLRRWDSMTTDTPSDLVKRLRALLEGLECEEIDRLVNERPEILRAVGAEIAKAARLGAQEVRWNVLAQRWESLAAAPNAAPQPHYDATCPCGKYVFGIPSAVAAPTDTPSDSVVVPEGWVRVPRLPLANAVAAMKAEWDVGPESKQAWKEFVQGFQSGQLGIVNLAAAPTNAASQPSTADVFSAPSQEGVGQGGAAVAAPTDTPSDLVNRLRGMSKQLRASAKHSPLTSDFGWHEWPGEAADLIEKFEADAARPRLPW